MTKYFCSLIFFLGFISLHGQANPEYMKKKKGTVKIYWENSKILKEEGEVSNHLKTGLWKSYDQNGNVIRAENYSNGILNGEFYAYFASGKIFTKGNYTNGIKTGKWEVFEEKGTRVSSHNYDSRGNQLGVQETFWYGGSMMKYSIVDSAKNFKVYSYNKFGKLVSVENFSAGAYNGLQYYYHKSETTQADPDTLPVKIQNYVNGKKEGETKYFANGKLIKEENYKNDKLDGLYMEWEKDGILRDSSYYENGERNGNSYRYKDGKLIFLIDYDHGKEKTNYLYYSESRNIKKIEWFGLYGIDSSLEFYDGGNKKIFYEKGITALAEYYTIWSPDKVEVLEFSYDNFHSYVTDIEVRSEKNVVLKKNAPGYKEQIQKYLPSEFRMDEKTGELLPTIPVIGEEVSTEPPVNIDQAKDNVIFVYAEKMPEFPGGAQQFQNYLLNNMKYPDEEMVSGKQGTVYVSFCVEKDGSITRVKVVKEVNGAPGFSKEAIRLISEMPRWEPGQMNGRAVAVSVTQPVRFTLDK